MENLIEKLINKEKITDEDIEEELYDICDREHASCNEICPMYNLKNEKEKCPYFKDGKAMLKKLREK